MKVLYVIDALAPGGAERSLLAMAPGLKGLVGDFGVVALYERANSLRPEFEELGVPVWTVEGASRAKKLAGLVGLLARERPHVVHTTLYEADVLGRVACAGLGIPVVSSCVSVSYGSTQRSAVGVNPMKLRAAQLLDAVTARAARRVHCNADHLAPFVATKLGIPEQKVVVIPRGRSGAVYQPLAAAERARIRSELGVREGEHFFLALARHVYAKGVDILLEAVAQLPASMSWCLLVAGRQGSLTTALRRQVDELGLAERVHLLGARPDVPELLGAADTLVAPSRWEGFCGAVLEGMAAGVPVAGTNIPGIAEVLGPVPSYLSGPADGARGLARQLQRAAEERIERRRAIGEAARSRFLAHFTLEAVVPRMYEELYLPAAARAS